MLLSLKLHPLTWNISRVRLTGGDSKGAGGEAAAAFKVQGLSLKAAGHLAHTQPRAGMRHAGSSWQTA